MRITDVKATVAFGRSIFVQVFTDEGVVGIGECSPMSAPVLAHFVEHVLKPLVIGMDPLEIDLVWHRMFHEGYKLGVQGVHPEAISGVDIALWDVKGKVTGLPVCNLLGGCFRDRIRMYCSIGGGAGMSVAQMVAKVDAALKAGFTAIKIRMDWKVSRQDVDPEKDYQMFKAVKELAGPTVPVSFDVNNGYSVSTAITQGRRFENLGIYHYEEPVAQYDYAGIARVADALDVPVSAGEHEYTRWQFRDLIAQARPDIIQPDVVKCAGITEGKRISVLGEVYNKAVMPHMTQPTVGMAANLHFLASLQSLPKVQEYTGKQPRLDDLFKEPLVFEDGHLIVPKRPGIGLEIDEAKLKAAAG